MEASGTTTDRGERRGRRGTRRMWLLVLPVVLLLVAWLSVPAWGPMLAGRYLPEGWSLGHVDLAIPGLRGTGVPRATAEGRLAGLRLAIQADGAEVRYAGPTAVIDRLSVVIELDGADDVPAGTPFSPEELVLPRLVFPGRFPKARVGTLDLTLVNGGKTQSWQFQDLVFDGSEAAADLALSIEDPPYLAEPLDLTLSLTPARLTLEATLRDTGSPLLRFAQQAAATPPTTPAVASTATAELNIDLGLSVIDTEALLPTLEHAGLPALFAADGEFRVEATFSGDDRLLLRSADVVARQVALDSGDGTLLTDLEAALRWEDMGWLLRVPRGDLELVGTVPGVRRPLEAALAATGIDLPLGDELALTLTLDDSVTGMPGLEARLDHEAPHGVRVDTRFRVTGTLDPATAFDVQVRDFDLTLEDINHADAFDLGAELDTVLNTLSPFTITAPPLIVGATEGALHFKGRLDWPVDGGAAVAGELEDATLRAFSLAHPANTVRLDRLSVSGSVDASPAAFRWAGEAEGERLITAPGDEVAANSLMTAEAARFQGEAAGPPDAMTVRGDVRLDGVLLPDLAMTLDGVDIDLARLALPAVDAQFAALTTGLEANLDGTRHRGLDLDVNATLEAGEALTGDGELLLGFSGALPFRFDARLDTAEATMTLDQAALPATAFADAARAAAVNLPEDLAFTGGDLVLDGALSVGPAGLGGAVDVRGDSLAFRFGESRFEGLEFTTRVSVADVISGDGPLLLELAQLAAGLDLLSVSTSLAFSGTDVGLLDLDAQLLGGTLSSPALRVTAGNLADSVVRWEGLDFRLLLTFLDVDGLDGDGTLDATVPLVSQGGQPGIDGARFAARGPGRLRYTSGAPATNIGLQALENFEYDSLEGTLDYAPNGDYTISMDLLGKNPDLYGGHPIRFRLNLGGAMPALFRSLFVTGNFEEAIIERLRAGEPFIGEEVFEKDAGEAPSDEQPIDPDGKTPRP